MNTEDVALVSNLMPDDVAAFEMRYAQGAQRDLDELHAWGRWGDYCDCEDASCTGFQMVHVCCGDTPSWAIGTSGSPITPEHLAAIKEQRYQNEPG